jgi:hypothetical protein
MVTEVTMPPRDGRRRRAVEDGPEKRARLSAPPASAGLGSNPVPASQPILALSRPRRFDATGGRTA